MIDPAPRVFISYARADDEPFVKRLYEDLTAQGFDVWWDRVSMPSRALTFLQEIRDAIAGCERLVLVVGPKAIGSDYVRAEWRFAQVVGKPVNTVLRLGDFDLLPKTLNLDKVDCRDFRNDADYEGEFGRLVEQLRAPLPRLGPLHGVPLPPAWYIDRGADVDDLLDAVTADVVSPVVITSGEQMHALYSMPGLGKSTLAAALGRHIDTRRRFSDGIFWVDLGSGWRERGEIPPLVLPLRDIGEALGDSSSQYRDVTSAKFRLTSLLDEKAVLLILDDVWDSQHAECFRVAGPRSRIIVTTRQERIANQLGAQKHLLEILSDEEGVRLITERLRIPVGEVPEPSVLRAIVRALGGHTLAVSIAAAWLEEHGGIEDAPELLRRLEKQRAGDNPFKDLKLKEGDRQLDLEYALSLSYADLDEDLRRRFRALGVLATGSVFDVTIASALAGDMDLDASADALYTLLRVGLLDQPQKDQFSQHSLLNAYALALLQRSEEWADPDEDELDTVRLRHAVVYASLALALGDQKNSYRLATHLLNLESASDFVSERSLTDLIYYIAWNADLMLDTQGMWDRRERWLKRALEAVRDDDEYGPERRARLRSSLADLSLKRGAWDEAEALYLDVLAVFEALDDRPNSAAVWGALADIAARRGAWDKAEELNRKALAAFVDLGDKSQVAAVKGALADLADKRGAWDDAEELRKAVVDDYAALGIRREVAVQKSKLANLMAVRGKTDKAEALFREALAVFAELGDKPQAAAVKGALAGVIGSRGSLEEAYSLLQESLPILEALGNKREIAAQKRALADLATKREDWSEAEALLREALARFDALGEKYEVASLKGRLADLLANRREWDKAEKLYAEALASLYSLGALRQEAVGVSNFAFMQYTRGKLDDAILLMTRLVEIETELEHPDLANNRQKLEQLKQERSRRTYSS